MRVRRAEGQKHPRLPEPGRTPCGCGGSERDWAGSPASDALSSCGDSGLRFVGFDEEKVADLRAKLRDRQYVDGAVERLADFVSERLLRSGYDGRSSGRQR